jgi:hypothetical protein
MITESVLIIVSILFALSADAWLDSRKQAVQLDAHLAALARDFETMQERVNASRDAALRGAETGRRLLTLIQQDAEIDAELAPVWLWHLVFYEVFTPSTGAYEALITSGNLESLDNDQLKFELADFFGSFEDVRASERLLLDTQNIFFASETFSKLAGWHRMGQGGAPKVGKFPVEEWSRSDEFMNWIGIYTVRQNDVLEDYRYLSNRIQGISAILATELEN